MTSVRDFHPHRRRRTATDIASGDATVEEPRVATAHRSATLPSHRSASIASRAESVNSAILRRKRGRTNTVTTYHDPDLPLWQPGAEPGLDTHKEEADDEPRLLALHQDCDVHITDFSDEHIITLRADNLSLKDALAQPRPDDLPCRWISVNGLSWDVIKALANKYGLHRLAVEDMINTRSRTKLDWYADHAFAILTLQKLVKVCTHADKNSCDCEDARPGAAIHRTDSNGPWWMPSKHRGQGGDVLPKYAPEDDSVANMIKAHETTSSRSPVACIRTLHRYEGGHGPEYVAFMEKHSVLADEDLVVSVEQVAVFLTADNTVISFFEHSGPDVEGPIFARLDSKQTMLRRSCDASLLLEAIVDTIVDLALPIREAYNRARQEMQLDVLTNPDIETSKSLYIFSEEIDMLQNLFKPIIHLINALRDHQSDPLHSAQSQAPPHQPPQRDPAASDRRPLPRAQTSTSVTISPLAHTYLGDVLDHCITHIQALEQMDASANNLSALIFNTVGAKTNNFMMILALVTVFFSPLTFISGYFGMNFDRFEAITAHSDAFFWAVGIPSVTVFMLAVAGSTMWGMLRSWFFKSAIRRIRGERNSRRAAWFRSSVDGGRAARRARDPGTWVAD